MPWPALRFGVTDGAGQRAATWKLVAGRPPKNDVYLMCRSLGGALKTSLHESGDWRTAYIEAAYQEFVEGIGPEAQDRIITKWPRSPEFARGITLAFRVVTPWTSVASPIKRSDVAKVTWVSNAPEGKATETRIRSIQPVLKCLNLHINAFEILFYLNRRFLPLANQLRVPLASVKMGRVRAPIKNLAQDEEEFFTAGESP